MASRNEAVYQMAQEWLRWVDSRRFLGPAMQKNILAQFMPSKAKAPPDGVMSAELNAFNLAVSALDPDKFIAFMTIYCEIRPKPIKWLAYELGIDRTGFYELAHSAAAIVHKWVRAQSAISEMMQREVADYV